jgi:hypothetical protein
MADSGFFGFGGFGILKWYKLKLAPARICLYRLLGEDSDIMT